MLEYSRIIEAIHRSLCEEDSECLMILPEQMSENGPVQAGTFDVPSSIFPVNSIIEEVNGGELFVESATDLVRASSATDVVVIPSSVGKARLSTEFRDRYGRIGIEEAVVENLLADAEISINTIVILVPVRFLTTVQNSQWRKKYFSEFSAIVIEHSAIQPLALSSIDFCTVVFSKLTRPVRFFKFPSDIGEEDIFQSALDDLERLATQATGKSRYGYVLEGALSDRYPATFDFYSEETEKLRQEVSVLGDTVALEEIAEVLFGYRRSVSETITEHDEKGPLAISARDITADGRVELSEIKPIDNQVTVNNYLEDSDICIRRISSAGHGFVVGVFKSDDRNITFDDSVIVVRPSADLQPVEREVLIGFLRSPMAQRLGNVKQVSSSLQGALKVSPHLLREFPVPIANKKIIRAMERLLEAKQGFTTWIEDIDDAVNAIVRESSVKSSSQMLIDSGRLARQRFRAAEQVEELEYRISTQYPHPLAFVWREVQVSGPDNYYRLKAITKAAEVHCCFLAQLCILLGQIVDIRIGYVKEVAERLARRRGGTNFGDWFTIVKQTSSSREFKKIENNSVLSELLNLPDKWELSAQKLMEIRNDDSHGRISPHQVTKDYVDDIERLLYDLFKSSEFLTDYRFIQITDTSYDSFLKSNRFRYQDLSGDNPLAHKKNGSSVRSDLEKGSLYLLDPQGDLHLLRPLFTYLKCPQCHQLSTFYLDSYDNANPETVGLKSIERGSVRTEPVANLFRQIGLLA